MPLRFRVRVRVEVGVRVAFRVSVSNRVGVPHPPRCRRVWAI